MCARVAVPGRTVFTALGAHLLLERWAGFAYFLLASGCRISDLQRAEQYR